MEILNGESDKCREHDMKEGSEKELVHSDENYGTNETLKNDSRLTKVGVEEDEPNETQKDFDEKYQIAVMLIKM